MKNRTIEEEAMLSSKKLYPRKEKDATNRAVHYIKGFVDGAMFAYNKRGTYTQTQQRKDGKMSPEEIREIADNIIFTQKRFFTAEEAARYLGISRSYLYKLTYSKKIPHYKPIGKMCYFEREELEKWLQRNRIAAGDEQV